MRPSSPRGPRERRPHSPALARTAPALARTAHALACAAHAQRTRSARTAHAQRTHMRRTRMQHAHTRRTHARRTHAQVHARVSAHVLAASARARALARCVRPLCPLPSAPWPCQRSCGMPCKGGPSRPLLARRAQRVRHRMCAPRAHDRARIRCRAILSRAASTCPFLRWCWSS